VHAEFIISGADYELHVRNLRSLIDYTEIHRDFQFDVDFRSRFQITFGIPSDLCWITLAPRSWPCAVVSHSTSRTILPWTVIPLESSGFCVLGFYEDKLQREVMVKCDKRPSGSHEQVVKLHGVFIGIDGFN